MIIGTPIDTTVRIAYSARITASVTVTPLDGVTAVLTSRTLYTIQGCRPTSVTTHPASIATTAATPDNAAGTRNHAVIRTRRWNHHHQPCHAASTNRKKPSPTIRSKLRWMSVSSGGSSAAGALFKPMTWVCGLNPTRIESNAGTESPK